MKQKTFRRDAGNTRLNITITQIGPYTSVVAERPVSIYGNKVLAKNRGFYVDDVEEMVEDAVSRAVDQYDRYVEVQEEMRDMVSRAVENGEQ